MPSVTMTLEELDEIRAEGRNALARVIELEKQLVEAKQHDPSGEERIARLNSMCRAFIAVTRFAVGNLPPETTPNWPLIELGHIAHALIEDLPDASIDDHSFVSDLKAFTEHCIECEAIRAERKAAAST